MGNPVCVWPVEAHLGEGALWSPEDQSLWFVDIEGCKLHRYTPATGKRESWDAPDRPGFIARRVGGGFVLGLAKGLASFTPEDGVFVPIVGVEEDLPENRLNDGAVGPDGALWFGSKHDPDTQPAGAWYRWLGHGVPALVDHGYVVTNGPGFSTDGGTMYFCDSTERRIYARALSGTGGRRLFAEIEPDSGYPDGVAVDAEGCLWVALFAGHGLRRYAPDGRHIQSVALPCSNVTKPAFGGADGRTLFVTTARAGLSDATLSSEPLAGGLFAIDVGVSGAALPAIVVD